MQVCVCVKMYHVDTFLYGWGVGAHVSECKCVSFTIPVDVFVTSIFVSVIVKSRSTPFYSYLIIMIIEIIILIRSFIH